MQQQLSERERERGDDLRNDYIKRVDERDFVYLFVEALRYVLINKLLGILLTQQF